MTNMMTSGGVLMHTIDAVCEMLPRCLCAPKVHTEAALKGPKPSQVIIWHPAHEASVGERT